MTPTPAPEIVCRDVWKVFGKNPQAIIKTIKPEQTRAHILETTGHVVGVRGVSFDIQKAQTFVVMGLSGSGKSTLVRCISRLADATSGQIIIGGKDVMQMDEQELLNLRRHKVSMVFQNFGLFPHRRVLDNVAYGLEVQGMEKRARYQQAEKMIDLVGLAGWEKHYPKQLSGGMQQRVGLARALAVDPEILLFDEPFSALDPLIRREMQDELIRLQTVMNKTIMFITHDFAEALKLGDRIVIMKDGEFVQEGTPEELVLNPKTDYVRAFTKDAPRSRVIAARSIMLPYPKGVTPDPDQRAVQADSKLQDIIPLVAATDGPVPVMDVFERVVGYIDRGILVKALVD
jgi:glycine betaine/proline transport system ATP-binding protein